MTKTPRTSVALDRRQQARLLLYKLVPLVLFVLGWHLFTGGNSRRAFFFGSPSSFARELMAGVTSGRLLYDTAVTAGEALGGFLIGNVIGTIAGLVLWHFEFLFKILRPYIIALGTAPLFAFAPIIVVWFGTGFSSKVIVATLSTVFVALMQAYKGADEVDFRFVEVVRSFGGGNWQVFRKIIVPASMVWVMSAFRLNIGFALLGAFLGEYISSERGLGHLILVGGGLYNVPLILVGVMMIIILGWCLSWVVGTIEGPLQHTIIRSL
jgi:NitT/TauT family transport system permease protein